MTKKAIYFIVIVLLFAMDVLSNSRHSRLARLGEKIYEDKNLSINRNQSCLSCHDGKAGFVDPENRKDPYNSVVSIGSDGISSGTRNCPSAAYAGFSPVFHWDDDVGGYVGGMFWDGRATGSTLGDPLAEQAQGPFLNPGEMALPNASAVVRIISKSRYAYLFKWVFPRTNFNNIPETFDNVARAIAAFERSDKVTRFRSKFDQFWLACKRKGVDISQINVNTDIETLPQGILNKKELKGLIIFNEPSKGNCAACHVTTDYVSKEGRMYPPLFTDFTYDNVGIPKHDNPSIEHNPVDIGLGGRPDINDSEQLGKFKVPTLRNVSVTAPYGHNGYFPALESIVSFYNTRDVQNWPVPEVSENVNTEEMGNLGLTPHEEHLLVVFMRSLEDRP